MADTESNPFNSVNPIDDDIENLFNQLPEPMREV